MTRVLSVTSGRADVGILAPVWLALVESGAALTVLATGMHLEMDEPHALAGVPDGADLLFDGKSIGGGDSLTCAEAMSAIQSAAAACYASVVPDAVLVTGDRLDMFPAAVAAVPFNLPLVHLHGGEVTEGALDDRLRHAMTKLAHLHCVSCEDARRRIAAMGEESWRIRVTGAPGLDTLAAATELAAETFVAQTGIAGVENLALVTVHPETNAADPTAPADAVFAALADWAGPILITAPNSDPGGPAIRHRIETFLARHPRAIFRETLGLSLYANALRQAAVVVGNSSSGIIEAGLFGTPVIDVGDRQAGRPRGANVTTVPSAETAVREALAEIGAGPARFETGTPYGDGRSGPRVAAAIFEMPSGERLLRKRAA